MSGRGLELGTILQHIVDTATGLAGARHGALTLLDRDRRRVTDLFTTGMSDAERRDLAGLPDTHAGVVGALAGDPRPLRLDDLTADPRSCGVPAGHPKARTFAGAPVQVRDEVLGSLCVTGKRSGGFTDTDLSLLRLLASQAGAAIGGAHLYEAARQRAHWIEGAAAVTRALLTGTGTTDALMTVAERARVLAGAAAGVILQPTADGGWRSWPRPPSTTRRAWSARSSSPAPPSWSNCWAVRASSSTTRRPIPG